jgi:hypothetical protein
MQHACLEGLQRDRSVEKVVNKTVCRVFSSPNHFTGNLYQRLITHLRFKSVYHKLMRNGSSGLSALKVQVDHHYDNNRDDEQTKIE